MTTTTHPASPMTEPIERPPANALGLRLTRRARETGYYVSLYDGGPAGMDTDGGRWQTVCEQHGWIISHTTFDFARGWLSHPLEWCEDCMDEAVHRDDVALMISEAVQR
jgi:hypothetical protein